MLRVQQRQTCEVGKHGFIAVDSLQHEEIGNLGHPATAWLGHPCCQGITALTQQPQKFIHI